MLTHRCNIHDPSRSIFSIFIPAQENRPGETRLCSFHNDKNQLAQIDNYTRHVQYQKKIRANQETPREERKKKKISTSNKNKAKPEPGQDLPQVISLNQNCEDPVVSSIKDGIGTAESGGGLQGP